MEEEDVLEPDEEAAEPDDETEAAAPGVEASFDELVSRQTESTDEEDEEESLLDLSREERIEALSIRAAPKQANEFVCSNCHLVKNQSQLADRKRELCLDCV